MYVCSPKPTVRARVGGVANSTVTSSLSLTVTSSHHHIISRWCSEQRGPSGAHYSICISLYYLVLHLALVFYLGQRGPSGHVCLCALYVCLICMPYMYALHIIQRGPSGPLHRIAVVSFNKLLLHMLSPRQCHRSVLPEDGD